MILSSSLLTFSYLYFWWLIRVTLVIAFGFLPKILEVAGIFLNPMCSQVVWTQKLSDFPYLLSANAPYFTWWNFHYLIFVFIYIFHTTAAVSTFFKTMKIEQSAIWRQTIIFHILTQSTKITLINFSTKQTKTLEIPSQKQGFQELDQINCWAVLRFWQ